MSILSCVILAGVAAASAAPVVFGKAIDTFASGGRWKAGVLLLLIYALLLAWSRAGAQLCMIFASNIQEKINRSVSRDYLAHVLSLPDDFFLSTNSARISSILQSGTRSIAQLIQVLSNVIFPGLLEALVSILVISTYLNWTIGLVIILYAVLTIYTTKRSLFKLAPLLHQATSARHDNAALLGNAVHAVETFRYSGGASAILSRYHDRLEGVGRSWSLFFRGRARFAIQQSLLFAVMLASAIAIVIHGYLQKRYSVGDLALLIMMTMQLSRPIEMLAKSVKDMSESLTELDPMLTILATEPVATDAVGVAFPSPIDHISCEGLNFYREECPIFRNTGFSIRGGKLTFIIGPTGAGKTTLFKILMRAIPSAAERIRINGVPIASIAREAFFREVAIVPQDICLLNDTLEFNITLGRACTREDVTVALRFAELDAFVASLPDGLNTVIGERGLRLSGGERQRLAIARALVSRPKILLLDEASSALDAATELAILERLRRLLPMLTVIAITHRVDSIRPGEDLIRLPGDGRCIQDQHQEAPCRPWESVAHSR